MADYLLEPVDGAASDVIALQVVTVGRDVSHAIDAAQAANDYSESYFLHGFSVQAAEALADAMHARIRASSARSGTRQALQLGLRRVPGSLAARRPCGACSTPPHAIGAELTEAFQIVPEQSTAAIVIHHPQATYFNAAAVRELTPA